MAYNTLIQLKQYCLSLSTLCIQKNTFLFYLFIVRTRLTFVCVQNQTIESHLSTPENQSPKLIKRHS